MKKKLAIVASHPVQYNAPWFRLLAASSSLDVLVFYTWSQSIEEKKYDPGFGKEIAWDIPLLDGYNYRVVKNTAKEPGSHHFWGIKNPDLIDDITSWEPQAVLVIGWAFKSHLHCLLHFKNRIPVLFRGDSTFLRGHGFIKGFFRKQWLKWVYRHVDYALYVGSANKDYFIQCGLSNRQLVFAPHAIDNGRFQDIDGGYSVDAEDWRNYLGIREYELVLLFAGKLEAVKNPFFLLDLAAKLQQLPFRLLIVGNGPLEIEMKAKATALNNVIFLDFQNQKVMPVVYRLANLFILCSISETWGLSVNEAMACGIPVIASSTCACTLDLLSDGKGGLAFGYNDMEAPAAYITELCTNRERLLVLGQQATEKIKNYSFENIVKAIDELMKKI